MCIRDSFTTQPFSKFDTIYMVTPLMDADLHKLINSNVNITKQHHQIFIYQILRGLKAIHSANVLHRDLKPKNILVNKSTELKICDLGMGRDDTGPSLRMTLLEEVATPYYRAPEGILFKNYSYDKSVDVWACGCILGELILRKPVFPGKSSPELIQLIIDLIGTPTKEEIEKIDKARYKEFILSLEPKKPKDFNSVFVNSEPLAVDLLQKIFVLDPEKRISVDQALAHPYLKDWHDPDDEPVANSVFVLESIEGLSVEEYRELIWKEIEHYQQRNKQQHTDQYTFTTQVSQTTQQSS
eukprot:TRINITY_DN6269_c0_g1_i2.p1 TRINITY_DN6269_c0_g1~~TRINITY_DN6269_c0_g1_i2.p1  ORF type:complete len:298 (-),score=42.52 TRINITY_DN6269_c0_g1_i2:84-977(-)